MLAHQSGLGRLLAQMHVHPVLPCPVDPKPLPGWSRYLARLRNHDELVVLNVFHQLADVNVRMALRSDLFAVVRYAPVIAP